MHNNPQMINWNTTHKQQYQIRILKIVIKFQKLRNDTGLCGSELTHQVAGIVNIRLIQLQNCESY